MFTLKNTETNTVTRFTPKKTTPSRHPELSHVSVVFVEQDNDGHLGIQADMETEEAREFWRICVNNGASRVK